VGNENSRNATKLLETPNAFDTKVVITIQLADITIGYGQNSKDATMGNQQPKSQVASYLRTTRY